MSTIRNVDFIHSNGKTWLFSETTHGSTPKQPSGWDSLTVRKRGKPADNSESHRPIALLNAAFKLLE
ncbi:hypothetical protein J6590_096957 [Homalodisca vitripennis]|nr:hypothetical protein J6590_096957 [Homalodisca vitripennis]